MRRKDADSAAAGEPKKTKKKKVVSVKREIKRKKSLISLFNHLGNVSEMCKEVGISRDCYYRWLRTNPEYKKQVEEIHENCIDLAESSLMQQIKELNTTATIFYLKTRGRDRGYVEKQEVKTEQGFPPVNLELAGGDDEN